MKTPHMDALAAKSLVFERMYTGVAVRRPGLITQGVLGVL